MMHRRASILVALLVAGCAVAVTPPTEPGRAPASRGKASGKPASEAPTASSLPSAAASAAPAASPTATAGIAGALASPLASPAASPAALAERLAFPTRLLPPLPAYLVGPDGASLVGPDGATLVGPDGASLVGPDGASYRLAGARAYALRQAAEATATPGNSTEGACPPIDIPGKPGELIKMTLQGYLQTVGLAEGLLAKAVELGLEPGVPETVAISFGRQVPPSPHTFLLERRAVGGMLRVAKGAAVTPADLVASLAFTSPEAGDMLLRLTGPMLGLQGAGTGFRISFDRTKGTSRGDYQTNVDMTPLGLPLGLVNERLQVVLDNLPPAGPKAPDVRLALSSIRSAPQAACQDMAQKMVVHYLPDGRAAMQFAVARTAGDALEFLGLERVRAAAPGPGTGFYVGTDGMYLSGDVTEQELGPAMPGAADVPAALPPLADPANPFADPAFQHPS